MALHLRSNSVRRTGLRRLAAGPSSDIARGGQGPFLHSVTLKGARRMIWIVALIAFVAGFAARDQMWRLWP